MSLVKTSGLSPRSRVGREEEKSTIPIGDLARTFAVSLRTLRFYEDRGLLVPRREGTARLYSERDKTRLESILRYKQLGFTLSEIREMIAEADKRRATGQLRPRQDQIKAQIDHLERQRRDIEGALSMLKNEQQALALARV